MKKTLSTLLILCLSMALPTAIKAQESHETVHFNGKWYKTTGENLIQNHSFEDNFKGWTSANDFESELTYEKFDIIEEGAQDGNKFLKSKYSEGARSTASIGTAWDIEKNKTYVFSFYLKYAKDTTAIPSTEDLKISLSNYIKGAESILLETPEISENNKWTKHQVVFTCKNSKYLQIKFRWLGDSWCFDNFDLREAVQITDGTRIACIGNSITEGLCIADPSVDSYPAQLGQLLGAGYEVGNFGVSGRTLLKKGDLPYWKEQKFTDSKNFNPNIVIIKLGTNDTKPYNWKYGSEFKDNLQELVDVYKNLPSSPKIYLAYPAKIFYNTYDIHDEIVTEYMIPIINEVAAQNNLDIIDFHNAYEGKNYFMTSDGVHPNERGATMMAELVKDIIAKQTLKNPDFETEDITPWNIQNHTEYSVSEDKEKKYLHAKAISGDTLRLSQQIDNLPTGKYILEADLKSENNSYQKLYVNINGNCIYSTNNTNENWNRIKIEFEVNEYKSDIEIGVIADATLNVDDFAISTHPEKLISVCNNILKEKQSYLSRMTANASEGLKKHVAGIIEKTNSLENNKDTLYNAISLLEKTITESSEFISEFNSAITRIEGLANAAGELDETNINDTYINEIKNEIKNIELAYRKSDIDSALVRSIKIFGEALNNSDFPENKVIDMTFMIKNPNVSSSKGWTDASTASGNQYPGAPDNTYLDKWNSQLNTYQDIMLPQGSYTLKAATRASSLIDGCYLYVQTYDKELKTDVKSIGHTGGELGNGWNWSEIAGINVTEKDTLVRIGFYANALNYHWASADVFSITLTGKEGDGDVSSIMPPVNNTNTSTDIHSINGILLHKDIPYSEIKNILKPGIYIANGKKIIIK